MRVVVIGLGVQGKKRLAIAGGDVVGTVDPVVAAANHAAIEQAPLDSFDAALACVPDNAKVPILEYLLVHGKHVLVEKPLLVEEPGTLERLKKTAEARNLGCYTAYNHRFEPHILALKKALDSGALGRIHLVKFFYGNGTARDVRQSPWRDQGMGVLSDIGSHLLDWTLMLFGKPQVPPRLWARNCFENRVPDHARFGFDGSPVLDYEVSLISWRNTFRADIYGELGSAHIEGLCKWGPSVFTLRKRILPSGRPDEESCSLICADPTWKAEYAYFKRLCETGGTNLENDLWINSVLQELQKQSID